MFLKELPIIHSSITPKLGLYRKTRLNFLCFLENELASYPNIPTPPGIVKIKNFF